MVNRRLVSKFGDTTTATLAIIGVFILLAGAAEHQHVTRIAFGIALCLPAIFLLLRNDKLFGR